MFGSHDSRAICEAASAQVANGLGRSEGRPGLGSADPAVRWSLGSYGQVTPCFGELDPWLL